jgi:hypothetical protein
MDRVIPLLGLIAVLGVVVALLARLFRSARQEDEAQSWPCAEATIQSAEMETVGSGRYAVVLPCFAFSYLVNGEYYSGRFSLSCSDVRSATLIREMVDKKLTIHYDPKKPSINRISEEMIEGCGVGRVPD